MKRHLLISVVIIMAAQAFSQQTATAIVTKSEADLVPEGIAVHPVSGLMYVSSINRHKIIIVDKAGKHRDFIKGGQDGFLEGLGMKVDRAGNLLWALSNIKKENTYTSQVHAFDVASGRKRHHFHITDTTPHLFNDLVVTPDGLLLITDTYFGALYELDASKQELRLLIKDSLIRYPNGITLDEERNQVYLATYSNGLIRYDRTGNKLFPLRGFKDTTLAYNLDGLVYRKNTLTGVYNTHKDRKQHAVIHYMLDETGRIIRNEHIIARGHAHFHEPTTLALKDSKIFVLANSHLGVYNANKESTSGIESKLTPVSILVYDLDKR